MKPGEPRLARRNRVGTGPNFAPGKASVQGSRTDMFCDGAVGFRQWIPAFAGMTGLRKWRGCGYDGVMYLTAAGVTGRREIPPDPPFSKGGYVLHGCGSDWRCIALKDPGFRGNDGAAGAP